MKRRSKLLLIRFFFIGLLATLIIVNFLQENEKIYYIFNYNTKEKNETTERKKPVIHTFFNNIDASVKGTGMSVKSDEEHVDAWKELWSNAGWDPVVLNLEDAKKHPRYDEFVELLDKVPLMGLNEGRNKVYNQLCFFRWLAMAAVGGGWMSDYDVIPLHHIDDEKNPSHNQDFLPNDGFFTVHCVVPRTKQGIPCLMSGNKDEWEKMAFQIVQNGVDHPEQRLWSDMMALMDLRHYNSKNELFFYEDAVIPGNQVLRGHRWSRDECHITENYTAVHFSHHAMREGKLEGVEPEHGNDWDKFNGRPAIEKNWHQMWKEVCGEILKEDSTTNPHIFKDLEVLESMIDGNF